MEQNRPREVVDDPVAAAIGPAVKVGAACGAAGFLFGGAAGIVRGSPPFLFATASSIQTFSLASIFTGFRHGIIHAWTPNGSSISREDLIKASAVAGCLSGGAMGGVMSFLARGRANPIPGALVFTLLGAAGQFSYNRWTTPKTIEETPKRGFWRNLSERSWSPVKVMTNDEYADFLKEKMLKIDVEISILDDKIAALREQTPDAPTSSESGG